MYILEGNIGVGKSTFLKLIQKYLPQITILTEPVENWAAQVYGQSLLENFYTDPKRWAYTLETLAMICRARDHVNEQSKNNPNIIMERSIYSGHYCFALNGYENGYFSGVEWQIYNKWIEFLLLNKCHPPKGFIYLKASQKVCFDRVQKRNRESEKGLTLEYLELIEQKHEDFLVQKNNIFENLKNVPVLILECNQDFLENEHYMQQHAIKVQEFLAFTQPNLNQQKPLQRTI